MSRSAQVVLDWADGTYLFALGIGQLEELQEKCEAGPWRIQWGLDMAVLAPSAGMAPPAEVKIAYVIETIRLGLIGGGMGAVEALKLVRAYVGPGQLTDNIRIAYAIISAALIGVPEDQPEKPQAGKKTSANRSRAEK